MDRIPQGMARIASRLISMAVSLVGDEDAVRKELNCSPEELEAYVAMRRQPTQAQLETLISIVVREQGRLIAKTRDLLARTEAKTPPHTS